MSIGDRLETSSIKPSNVNRYRQENEKAGKKTEKTRNNTKERRRRKGDFQLWGGPGKTGRERGARGVVRDERKFEARENGSDIERWST